MQKKKVLATLASNRLRNEVRKHARTFQLHFTITFENLLLRVSRLYEEYTPDTVKNRKNKQLAKQSDVVILTCYLFGILHSCTTLIGIYRLACSIYGNDFPSRTHFIRTRNNLQPTLALINQAFMKGNSSEVDAVGLV